MVSGKTFKHSVRGLFYKFRYHDGRIRIHCSSKVSRSSILRASGNGKIRVGRNCSILDYTLILNYGGDIEIGDDCTINPFCVLYGHGGLKIGNDVRIAAHSVIIPSNHTFKDLDVPIWQQSESCRGIVIEDDVWIGAGCRVLDGARIGRGSVIGAGAVVNRSIPEFSIAVGVPARIVRNRKETASPRVFKERESCGGERNHKHAE